MRKNKNLFQKWKKFLSESVVNSREELIDIISNGKVRFNKSDVGKKPCALYFVESGSLNLLIENCDKKAKVEFR